MGICHVQDLGCKTSHCIHYVQHVPSCQPNNGENIMADVKTHDGSPSGGRIRVVEFDSLTLIGSSGGVLDQSIAHFSRVLEAALRIVELCGRHTILTQRRTGACTDRRVMTGLGSDWLQRVLMHAGAAVTH